MTKELAEEIITKIVAQEYNIKRIMDAELAIRYNSLIYDISIAEMLGENHWQPILDIELLPDRLGINSSGDITKYVYLADPDMFTKLYKVIEDLINNYYRIEDIALSGYVLTLEKEYTRLHRR